MTRHRRRGLFRTLVGNKAAGKSLPPRINEEEHCGKEQKDQLPLSGLPKMNLIIK